MKNRCAYIGLMSGTSMDGVDGIVLDELGRKILFQSYSPYPEKLKKNLLSLVKNPNISLEELVNLDIEVANCFADMANFLQQETIEIKEIKAIGSHGQTIFHQGGRYSMQIGHGALIAEQTGVTTISDFRMQDIAAGGQGAPLTPIYHQYLLNKKNGVIVNLGGIANITIVKNNKAIGFDTGPANTLLDAWVKQEENLDYDKNGVIARSGVVDEILLKTLLADVYFKMPAPKSTGPEYFNLHWLKPYLPDNYLTKNITRTLLELTAVSVSQHIPINQSVYLCGGGVHNSLLIERLSALNPQSTINTTESLGINPDFVEAAAFAFFASKTLQGKHLDLSSVTGAKSKRILGAIYKI